MTLVLSGELLHPLILTLLHLLGRQVFLVRGDGPLVPMRVGDRSAAIAPELIGHLPHRADIFAPAFTARLNNSSQFSTYSHSAAGDPPNAVGPFAPPIGSLSMIANCRRVSRRA